jgi:hypothetical protein
MRSAASPEVISISNASIALLEGMVIVIYNVF